MANEKTDTDTDDGKPVSGLSVLKQIEAEFAKSSKDRLKAKAKTILEKKMELDKANRLLDAELDKLMSDYEAGLI